MGAGRRQCFLLTTLFVFFFDCDSILLLEKGNLHPIQGELGLAWTETRTKFGLANAGGRQLFFGDRKKKAKQRKREPVENDTREAALSRSLARYFCFFDGPFCPLPDKK